LINFGLVIYEFWFHDVGEQVGFNLAYNACRVLVFGLLGCHVFWFWLIWKTFRRTIASGRSEIRGARSDDIEKKEKSGNAAMSNQR
jgi:hypothetical protein